MFERETVLYEFVLGYIKRLTSDIEDEKLAWSPQPGVHSAAWILSHLAIATDYALMNLGQKPALPKEWHKRFGPGSPELAPGEARPTRAELLDALTAGQARVIEAAKTAKPENMQGPHPVKVLEGTPIKTVEQLVAHLMTTHAAVHTGQLSFWRRCAGKPHLF